MRVVHIGRKMALEPPNFVHPAFGIWELQKPLHVSVVE
jgi:hypothetical protein